jgi:hypothetical protein
MDKFDDNHLEYSGNLFGISPDNISLGHTSHMEHLKNNARSLLVIIPHAKSKAMCLIILLLNGPVSEGDIEES